MAPNSMNISTADKQNTVTREDSPPQLDAGALFVLQSKGSWVHCGYHLTTSIVGPVIFSLPFALSLLGWGPGIASISLSALVTFYSYNLLSLVLEHHAQLGRRQLRFRDMAEDILGAGWGKYFVGPLQFAICYGAVIACTLLGGQCLKHINLVSLMLCLTYSACATAGSIYIGVGNSKKAPPRDYSVNGSQLNHFFSSINGVSIIATTFGSGIIPEIQATIAPPVKGKMFKGLCICYAVIISTYFSVAVSGYWTFGNASKSIILTNFMDDDGKPLLPIWFLLLINIFALMQLAAITVIYLQPTNEMFERWFSDPKKHQFAARNVAPRLVFRSLTVVVATLIAAMLPFFGDIMAFFGAFGCIPLDYILPMVFYNTTFKPPRKSIIFWGNTMIAVISSILAAVGGVASVRQIVLDAKTYSIFADVTM
ncbi:GABA transporter 1 [Linum grandiflorum]